MSFALQSCRHGRYVSVRAAEELLVRVVGARLEAAFLVLKAKIHEVNLLGLALNLVKRSLLPDEAFLTRSATFATLAAAAAEIAF